MDASDRVMIVAIPRSGAYLLAGVLRELGYTSTQVPVPTESVRWELPEGLRGGSARQDTVQRIGPGQFAVSHMPYDDQRRAAMRDYRVLFLKRDPRECLVSCMRCTLNTRRRERYPDAPWLSGDSRSQVVEFLKDRGFALSRLFRSVLPWNEVHGVQQLRFEDLIDGHAEGLLGHGTTAVRLAVAAAVKRERSVGGTVLADYWSDRAEAVFRLLFKNQHVQLGYPEPVHLRRVAAAAQSPA